MDGRMPNTIQYLARRPKDSLTRTGELKLNQQNEKYEDVEDEKETNQASLLA
jgi:hypothetical protein